MITIQEVKSAIKRLDELDADLDVHAKATKILNEEKTALKAHITGMLKEMNEKTFKSEFGTVTKVTDFSVKMPQGEDKEKFFNYLKERGAFESLVSVNYQTLNSYYKEQKELAVAAAKANGDAMAALNFSLPGIGEPKSFETIRFTK